MESLNRTIGHICKSTTITGKITMHSNKVGEKYVDALGAKHGGENGTEGDRLTIGEGLF